MRFLAIDFETSGVDVKRHAPVSLGVALFEGAIVVDQLEQRIGPPFNKEGKITREYDVCALEVNGATWASIKNAPPPEAACAALMGFAKRHDARELPVVAFNAPFDLAFYSELLYLGGSWNQIERCYQTFAPPLVGPWQCVRLLAVHRLGQSALPKWNLDCVAEHFGLSRSSGTHGAIEDAVLAGKLYAALINEAAEEAA